MFLSHSQFGKYIDASYKRNAYVKLEIKSILLIILNKELPNFDLHFPRGVYH